MFYLLKTNFTQFGRFRWNFTSTKVMAGIPAGLVGPLTTTLNFEKRSLLKNIGCFGSINFVLFRWIFNKKKLNGWIKLSGVQVWISKVLKLFGRAEVFVNNNIQKHRCI